MPETQNPDELVTIQLTVPRGAADMVNELAGNITRCWSHSVCFVGACGVVHNATGSQSFAVANSPRPVRDTDCYQSIANMARAAIGTMEQVMVSFGADPADARTLALPMVLRSVLKKPPSIESGHVHNRRVE